MIPPVFQSLREHDYHPRLAAIQGLGLVLFSSPDCGTCRRVEALLPAAAPVEAMLFHVDVQQSPGLAKAFDVFHLPDLFLYRAGRFHARLACEVTPTTLRRAIDGALAKPPEDEP